MSNEIRDSKAGEWSDARLDHWVKTTTGIIQRNKQWTDEQLGATLGVATSAVAMKAFRAGWDVRSAGSDGLLCEAMNCIRCIQSDSKAGKDAHALADRIEAHIRQTGEAGDV